MILSGVLVWWLWPNTESQQRIDQSLKSESSELETTQLNVEDSSYASSIEPINIIDPNLSGNGEQKEIGFADSVYVQRDFEKATEHLLAKEWQQAEVAFKALIEEYPQAIEPYINLAVVYANTDRLDLARQTLTEGVNANPNYGTLFENLKSIHGAIAAEAYRKALIEDESINLLEVDESLDLPIINTIDVQPVNRKRQQNLRKQIKYILSRERDKSAEAKTTEAQLNAEIDSLNEQIEQLEKNYAKQVEMLQLQVAELQNDRATQQVATLTASSSSAVKSNETANDPTVGQEVDVSIISSVDSTNTAASSVSQIETTEENESITDQQVTDLVKRWAKSWSDQNVSDYTSHYSSGYRPKGSSLTHQQWLAQRKVRLTNKKFIDVKVDDFKVDKTDNQVSVIFSQHYRSNTMDDKIRKQLTFRVDKDNYLNSKIISERVIR